MNSPDEFERIMAPEFPQESIDRQPYGSHQVHVKPGLTARGKIAVAIGAAALATGGMVGYQAYSANQAESAAKAQEISYKKDLLELKKLELQSQVNKAQASTVSVRQKHIDACVADGKDLVGKSLNSSYRDIVEACQAQYTADGSPAMETAASSSSSADHINVGVYAVGAAAVLGLVFMVRRGARSHGE